MLACHAANDPTALERTVRRWDGALVVAACFAAVKLLVHLFTANGYGYFRDELYYIACGEHLDWGYVDHAPMVGWAARLARTLFSDSLFGLRLLPAVAGALKVFLTGLLAREFGGRNFAVALACLSVLVGGHLVLDGFFSMNAFESLLWAACAYAVVLAVKRDEPRYWLLFGLLAGVGLLNKHSMLFLGFGVFVGLLLTPARGFFKSKWLWLGGALAFGVFLPNIVWEYRHEWATLELLSNVRATGKNVELSPLEFILQQAVILHPFTLPVWLAGLWYFLFDREGRRYRVLGVAYVVVLLLLIALKGKNYYLLPIYPILFAGGGVWFEGLIRARRRLRWLKYAYPLLLVVGGALLAPLAVPLLPVETFIRYQNALGFEPPKTEVGHKGPLPQHFGDRFGWPEMVEEVARVYHALPPEDRAVAGIYAGNYGEAGAVDLFGPRYGLPKAVSPHQNYFLWGPRDVTGEVLILLQSKRADAERNCRSVEEAATLNHPYAMGEEHYTILVCRGLKRPLRELWPDLKHWN